MDRAKRNKALMCTVPTESQAETIVSQLRDAGVPADNVTVVFPDMRGARTLTFEPSSKMPEGALFGVVAGAVLGAVVAVALAFADRLGVTAPWMAALAGAAIGAGIGGVIGATVGATVPEIETRLYAGRVEVGDLLIVAHIDDAQQKRMAKAIFTASRGSNIAQLREVTPRS